MQIDYRHFRPVRLEDRTVIQPLLNAHKPRSCEFAFANLYAWQPICGTRFLVLSGTLWVHLSIDDILLFSGNPTTCEIESVVTSVQRAGYRGELRTFTPLPEAFQTSPCPDSLVEYLYNVDDLVALKGSRYAPKRNLISQFHHNHPSAQVVTLTVDLYPKCHKLMEEWVALHSLSNDDTTTLEYRAFTNLLEAGHTHVGAEGIAIVSEAQLLAFSIFAPISNDIWVEPFEKAGANVKGGYQAIVQATATALSGRAITLNREQDLGLPGLRKSKLSWHPIELLTPQTLQLNAENLPKQLTA